MTATQSVRSDTARKICFHTSGYQPHSRKPATLWGVASWPARLPGGERNGTCAQPPIWAATCSPVLPSVLRRWVMAGSDSRPPDDAGGRGTAAA